MPKLKWMIAKEPIVINVGGRPVEYHGGEVRDRRTGEMVYVDFSEIEPKVPADPGVPYAFKANEKVRANHPAVKACPSAFMDADDE